MSNVRLSNGSPTLERMEARQADYPKPSACRSLFGPVDHEQLARELEKHGRALEEAGRSKWNFDFQRCQPLQGNLRGGGGGGGRRRAAAGAGDGSGGRCHRSRAPEPRAEEATCCGRFLSSKQKSQHDRRGYFRRLFQCLLSGTNTQEIQPKTASNVNCLLELRTFISLIFEGIKFMKQGRCRVYI
ncbi:Cyclin-dependent kinase inhibitor 1B [Podarcis lilfordi]|uniref:Cyclin-dependent kinase inhibitor 1B n=1 Tax=Podarcis lilfordi TaxID=74358 RepID=A0AA35P6U6_9SAUR|nr:Cyclin-dependent kinase inhibitor 1B [Podarcis lilfordi]